MRKNKQIKILLVLIFTAVSSLLITSCYPDYGLTVEDFDIVATFKDDAANFQTYKTYFMPDSIKRLADGAIGSSNTQYDAQILQEIKNQMQAYGYTPVPEQLADVKLFVGLTTSTTYAYYPGYWYGYYGWYYPWYGYGGGYTYAYSSGSLFVTMFDPDKMDAAKQILGAVWSGTLNGVLDDTQSNKLTRTLTWHR